VPRGAAQVTMKIAPGLQAFLTGRARVSEHLLGLTHPDVGEDVAAADVDPRLSASPLFTNACSASSAPPHPVPLPLRGRGDRNGSLSLFDQEGRGEGGACVHALSGLAMFTFRVDRAVRVAREVLGDFDDSSAAEAAERSRGLIGPAAPGTTWPAAGSGARRGIRRSPAASRLAPRSPRVGRDR